jgi:hypothetical protein
MEVFSGSFHEEIWSLGVPMQSESSGLVAKKAKPKTGLFCGLCGPRTPKVKNLSTVLRYAMISGEEGFIYR